MLEIFLLYFQNLVMKIPNYGFRVIETCLTMLFEKKIDFLSSKKKFSRRKKVSCGSDKTFEMADSLLILTNTVIWFLNETDIESRYFWRFSYLIIRKSQTSQGKTNKEIVSFWFVNQPKNMIVPLLVCPDPDTLKSQQDAGRFIYSKSSQHDLNSTHVRIRSLH